MSNGPISIENSAADIRPTGPQGPQYARIARHGEPEYAAIVRNRSGQDAGCIEFGCKVTLIEEMNPADKRDIVLAAGALLASVETSAGLSLEKAVSNQGRGMNTTEAMWEILRLKDCNKKLRQGLARAADHLASVVREGRGLEATAEISAHVTEVFRSTSDGLPAWGGRAEA